MMLSLQKSTHSQLYLLGTINPLKNLSMKVSESLQQSIHLTIVNIIISGIDESADNFSPTFRQLSRLMKYCILLSRMKESGQVQAESCFETGRDLTWPVRICNCCYLVFPINFCCGKLSDIRLKMNTHLESCPMTNILAYKTLKEAFVSINHEGDNAQKYLERYHLQHRQESFSLLNLLCRSIFKTLKEVSATIHKAKTLREQCAPYTTIALPLFMLHLLFDKQSIIYCILWSNEEGRVYGKESSRLTMFIQFLASPFTNSVSVLSRFPSKDPGAMISSSS